MNKEEITAHDAHYEKGSMRGYKDALWQSLDQVGLIALESEIRDFTCSLWQKGFVITPIGQTFEDQPITAELLELYGFIADEPGYWFLDGEDYDSVRVEQSLRHQDQWRLFMDGGPEKDDVQVDLMNFSHLLKVLEENGITFTDDEDDE